MSLAWIGSLQSQEINLGEKVFNFVNLFDVLFRYVSDEDYLFKF